MHLGNPLGLGRLCRSQCCPRFVCSSRFGGRPIIKASRLAPPDFSRVHRPRNVSLASDRIVYDSSTASFRATRMTSGGPQSAGRTAPRGARQPAEACPSPGVPDAGWRALAKSVRSGPEAEGFKQTPRALWMSAGAVLARRAKRDLRGHAPADPELSFRSHPGAPSERAVL